jgi:hypothetical protein
MMIDIGCVFDRAAYDELRQAFDISPMNLAVMIFAERCEPTSFRIVSDQFHASVRRNQNAQVRHLNFFVDPVGREGGRPSVHWAGFPPQSGPHGTSDSHIMQAAKTTPKGKPVGRSKTNRCTND